MAGGGDVHLPFYTFRNIVQKENLEVTIEARDGDDGDCPFRFKAILPDVAFPISAISASEELFD